eukprot:Amastigsp_a509638_393.p4 type:complete len:119 gc:universal Amastigsp_a509638_393:203-559(+)
MSHVLPVSAASHLIWCKISCAGRNRVLGVAPSPSSEPDAEPERDRERGADVSARGHSLSVAGYTKRKVLPSAALNTLTMSPSFSALARSPANLPFTFTWLSASSDRILFLDSPVMAAM